ncbi:MAG: ZIP family metal transporter [Clostridia bacterium]|jgi:ZIP family zinc transporter|nr:ZIP family metal transporter [Clostridia bacterium]
MEQILKTTILGLFFGTFGTTIGGILGIVTKKNSNKFLSFVLSFASGLMMSIICFDLIPEALGISSIYGVIFGVLIGIVTMIFCDIVVQKKFNKKANEYNSKNDLLRTGIIVSIGLAIHNFPEGLAIGSGFEASLRLGLGLAIAICLHDIPEGISMSVPMKNGGMSKSKVIFYVILSGVTTGIGAFFGAIIGSISESVIAICLSFAAGAMLYIVSGELIPESNKLYKGRMSAVGNMIGFIIGIFATKL